MSYPEGRSNQTPTQPEVAQEAVQAPNISSRMYFTAADVSGEVWFKKLLALDQNRPFHKRAIQECVEPELVLGEPHATLHLRSALRYLWLREFEKGSLSRPPFKLKLDSLLLEDEKHWQHAVMQVLTAAVGGQSNFKWLEEDYTRREPREAFIGIVKDKQITSVEMKQWLSYNVLGNAHPFGQVMQNGRRDANQPGEYVGIYAVSLSHFFFVRIKFGSSDAVLSYSIYPPIHSGDPRANFIEIKQADGAATDLQTILPQTMPRTFTRLVQFTDCVCQMNGLEIDQPIVKFFPPGSTDPLNAPWHLKNVEIMRPASRSLIMAADNPPFNSSSITVGASSRVVIKIANKDPSQIKALERIHRLVDGKVRNIRQLVGRVEISDGQKRCLPGIVLAPFGQQITDIWFWADEFFEAAVTILQDLHGAGVVHRDVKPSHFLSFNTSLILIDFDVASAIADDSNQGFEGGTPRFSSPFLGPGHRYSSTDDFLSLILSVCHLCSPTGYSKHCETSKAKLALLQQIAKGNSSEFIIPKIAQFVTRLLTESTSVSSDSESSHSIQKGLSSR